MTKREYVAALRDLYLVANASDSDRALPWLQGNECAEHCQRYDAIARHMGLSENWLETLD